MRVSIMQPYFVPYLGYFRLFTAVDVFVILDSVQFPNDGFVHRNKLPDHLMRARWLKLPLAKTPLHTIINDLSFHTDARARLQSQYKEFPVLAAPNDETEGLMRIMLDFDVSPVVYLMRTMRYVCNFLGTPWCVIRSSDMPLAPELRGQERVIEIVRQLRGDTYVNSPGGRLLYDKMAFAKAGIKLRFLPEYNGVMWSVLWRIATSSAVLLRSELDTGSELVE